MSSQGSSLKKGQSQKDSLPNRTGSVFVREGSKRECWRLKPDGRTVGSPKFKSRRVKKAEGISFSPAAFFLLMEGRDPFCFFIQTACFTQQLPVLYLKIQAYFPTVGLILSQQSFLKAAPKLRPKR